MNHIVSLSGGKDSSAMALRLAEVEPGTPRLYICTPTGRELPEMMDHWARLETLLGAPIIRLGGETFEENLRRNRALPNFRMRFCTRQLKIEPALAFMAEHAPALLYSGLRADEPERPGIHGEGVTCRFPLREWGWGLGEVVGYLREREVRIPQRTDCDLCFYQRLSEWRALWRKYPDRYQHAVALEGEFGNTFRSPGRDSQPAALSELRVVFEEEARTQPALFEEGDWACDDYAGCRGCRL
jgi:hypothetical protein